MKSSPMDLGELCRLRFSLALGNFAALLNSLENILPVVVQLEFRNDNLGWVYTFRQLASKSIKSCTQHCSAGVQ